MVLHFGECKSNQAVVMPWKSRWKRKSEWVWQPAREEQVQDPAQSSLHFRWLRMVFGPTHTIDKSQGNGAVLFWAVMAGAIAGMAMGICLLLNNLQL